MLLPKQTVFFSFIVPKLASGLNSLVNSIDAVAKPNTSFSKT